MDQDNTKGQDKRNWRERLGIGAQGNKELPKISDDFRKETPQNAARPTANARPAPRPAATAAPAATVKPAPMAPRAPSRATPQAPVSPDKLAERLRSQREASTRLAEQRVQVAKQRGETQAAAPVVATPPANPAAKPKFTFAEEAAEARAAAPAPKPAVTPPPLQNTPPPVQQQLSPARPPLGGGVPPLPPGFPQQRPQVQPYQQPPMPGYQPQGQMPPGYPPAYGQQPPVPPYRPLDPNSGYAPQPGYVPPPQRGFGVPPQQPQYMPQTGPRLNVPPRADPQRPTPGLNPNYQPQQDYGAPPPAGPGGFAPQARMNRPPLRGPAPPPVQEPSYEDDFYDEVPAPRGGRPSSNDYQQAYREAEYGYEDEAPRSKAPWILAGMLLFAVLLAGAGVWAYQNFGKPLISGQSATQEVPAVAAPEAPAKVQAEQPAEAAPAGSNPTKKQIYDRIVGDQEVLGGEVSAPAETPAAIPEPANTNDAAPLPTPGSGDDAAPVPIPPPPGGTGDQQGSLDPNSGKQSSENITPAAGESLAAVAAQNDIVTPSQAAPPAPGEVSQVQSGTRSVAAEPVTAESETIADEPPAPALAPKKKAVVAEKKKQVADKEKQVAKLGAKPVVLVPPAKKTKAAASESLDDIQVSSGSEAAAGGLYDAGGTTAPEPAVTAPAQAPKKKKTLADLFSGAKDEPVDDAIDVASVEEPAPLPAPAPKAAAKKVVAATPAPVQEASTGSGYSVQLASFRSRDEASREYARLKAKHAGALGPYSPIISEASVGGSTRFRLSVGSMQSQAQASAVCSSLFAGGERDCLVKKR